MSNTFEQGWAAKPFKVQFPQLSDESASRLDAINEAITLLYLSGIITHSMVASARQKKFPKVVADALAKSTASTP